MYSIYIYIYSVYIYICIVYTYVNIKIYIYIYIYIYICRDADKHSRNTYPVSVWLFRNALDQQHQLGSLASQLPMCS